MQTHQDYLEAPYQARYEENDRKMAAVDEFGDEEAAKLLRETVSQSPDYVVDPSAFESVLIECADAIVVDDEARGARAAEMIGREVIRSARAWLALRSTEAEIWRRCVKRAESYR